MIPFILERFLNGGIMALDFKPDSTVVRSQFSFLEDYQNQLPHDGRHKYSSIFPWTQKSCAQSQMTPDNFLSTALFYKSQAPQLFVLLLKCSEKWGWQHQWHPAENSPWQNFIFIDKETVMTIPTQTGLQGCSEHWIKQTMHSPSRETLCSLAGSGEGMSSCSISHVTLHHNKISCKKKFKNPCIFPLKLSSSIFSLSFCFFDTTEVGFYWYITVQTGHALNP